MSKIRIRKRGKTYSYSFDVSKNPRRMKEKGGFATEDEAYEAGVKAYADWKSGNIGITSEKIKLRDYLAAWLENVVRPNVKRTTHQNYSRAIKDRILVSTEVCCLSGRAHCCQSGDKYPYPPVCTTQSSKTCNCNAGAVRRYPQRLYFLPRH